MHFIAHQLGGFYNLPHGVCNATLLPYVEMYNKQVYPERFVDIAKAMGKKVEGLSLEAAADKATDAIKKLTADIGIPSGLKEFGAKEDLELLTENAMQDVCHLTNPEYSQKKRSLRSTREPCDQKKPYMATKIINLFEYILNYQLFRHS